MCTPEADRRVQEWRKGTLGSHVGITGELLRADLFRDRLSGDRAVLWLAVLHFGAFTDLPLTLLWFLGAMSLPLMAITGVAVYVTRWRRSSRVPALDGQPRRVAAVTFTPDAPLSAPEGE